MSSSGKRLKVSKPLTDEQLLPPKINREKFDLSSKSKSNVKEDNLQGKPLNLDRFKVGFEDGDLDLCIADLFTKARANLKEKSSVIASSDSPAALSSRFGTERGSVASRSRSHTKSCAEISEGMCAKSVASLGSGMFF